MSCAAAPLRTGRVGRGGVLVTRSGPVNGALCLFCLQPERLAGEEMAGAQHRAGNANQQAGS